MPSHAPSSLSPNRSIPHTFAAATANTTIAADATAASPYTSNPSAAIGGSTSTSNTSRGGGSVAPRHRLRDSLAHPRSRHLAADSQTHTSLDLGAPATPLQHPPLPTSAQAYVLPYASRPMASSHFAPSTRHRAGDDDDMLPPPPPRLGAYAGTAGLVVPQPLHAATPYARAGLMPFADDPEPVPGATANPAGRPRPAAPGTPAAVAEKVGQERARSAAEKASGGANASGAGRYAALIPEKRPPTAVSEHIASVLGNEAAVLALYTLLSLVTRLYRIGRSPTVIWDEAHFGKFGSHYLKHEFYFDVHPPLGKMLVGLAGFLSGYRGQFEFKSGEHYPPDVNYLGMRVLMAMFGVAMVPIAYSTSGALGWNWRSRHLLATMVLLDNAWLVISRFILLDSMLLFFTFTTVHGLVMFHRQQTRPFGEMWWFWLTFTGLSIGCVTSVKWVGLFAMALVGLYTIEDLWDKFGDLRMPVRQYARHWCARALCLIFLPLTVYMASFAMHFLILNRSGPGDAQMSSLFQARLAGNDFSTSPLEAAYGSKVTFKNMGYGGGLLHSHVQTYPSGSQQQQVTCYHYKDDNNHWTITPVWGGPELPSENSTQPPTMLRSGDSVRLVHASTGRNLHSHAIPAPVTKENYEVSGYGNATIGDVGDHWVVEIVDDLVTGRRGARGEPVRSLTTRMRFRHELLGCYLRAANAVLPQWGWKQIEVSCDKENNPRDAHTYWNIENHWNEKLPAGNTKLYRSPFLRDFIHLNVAMMTSNNALIPDADKEDILASKPFDWPWLWNGLRMNSWADNSVKYYLVGNPAIWWTSSASLFVFAATLGWYLARLQRGVPDFTPAQFNRFVYVGKIAGLGWFLHYFPFLVMARVTYIHHYLPTLYFQVMLLVHLLDHFFFSHDARLARRLSARAKDAILALAVGVVAGTFWWFRHSVYGYDGPIASYRGIRWRKSWNIQ